MSKPNILPIFIPFLGCDNRCIFCNQEAITDIKIGDNLYENILSQYNKYIATGSSFDTIAFYGGNFGALDKDDRLYFYNFAKDKGFNKIRYSTRVDTITDELLNEAKIFNVKMIELGIQSLDNNVLISNERPYKKEDVFTAINRVVDVTDCGIQMMIGMYNQSINSAIDDAKILSKLNIKTVRIYPTVVINNTLLAKLYLDKKYIPLDISDAVILSAITSVIYASNNIKIIRLSLPDDVDSNDNILAGLYHKSYGDIVRSIIMMLYLDLGYFITGSRDQIYHYAGYKAVVRENYSDQFIVDESSQMISFDTIIDKVYEGYKYFEDSSRAFKGKTAFIAKKIRY